MDDMIMMSAVYFLSVGSLKQVHGVDMSLHSDTLSWSRVNKSLLFS